MRHVPVVICGAGPVGLTTSILLSRMGVASLLVESRAGVSRLPRARGIMSRTVEIWSQFGLYPEMTDFSLPASWCDAFLYMDTLGGELIGAMPSNCMSPDAQRDHTAYEFRCAAQDQIDAMLWRCAARYDEADIRFSTELTRCAQDDNGLTIDLRSGDGTAERVRAQWLVAADGGRSGLREAAGIGSTGPADLGSFLNTHFTADLSRWTQQREAVLLWTMAEGRVGCFQPLDGAQRWMCQIMFDREAEPIETWDHDRVRQRLRDMVGDDDAAQSVAIDLHSFYGYTVAARIADRLRDGRLLLVGDAAHRIPPAGGIGMNTGIQTAHNLAWKLAAVIEGTADPALLDTMDTERREVAARACAYGAQNIGYINDIRKAATPGEQRATLARSRQYGNWAGLDLGVHYERPGAFVPDDIPAPPVEHPVVDYVPSAKPGHRAPHVWLRRGAERCSTTDLFDRRFTLLTGAGGTPWVDAARELPVEVAAYRVCEGGDFVPEADFAACYGILDDGAVLVRPDGHVAWRSAAVVAEPSTALRTALHTVLRPAERAVAVP